MSLLAGQEFPLEAMGNGQGACDDEWRRRAEEEMKRKWKWKRKGEQEGEQEEGRAVKQVERRLLDVCGQTTTWPFRLVKDHKDMMMAHGFRG